MSINEEFKRVLANPDHVIVSDELKSLMHEDAEEVHEDTRVFFDDVELLCKISKIHIEDADITFSLDIPSFSLSHLLNVKDPVRIHFENLIYVQVVPSDIRWEDNLLTFKTRRIFNETVQA